MITAFSPPLWIDDISNNIGSIFLIAIGFAVIILFYSTPITIFKTIIAVKTCLFIVFIFYFN